MKTVRGLMGAVIVALLLGLAPVALADSSTATITGTVIDQSTGQPITGADVSTQDSNGNWYSVQTDSSGDFTLSGLPADSYTLIAEDSPQYQSSSAGPITVAAGQTVQGVTIALQSVVGNLTGRVTDAGGTPLAGMQVQLSDSNGVTDSGWTAFSSDSGTYTITSVPAGTYSVTVLDGVPATPNQQPVQLGTATINAAGTTTDNLQLPAPQVPAGTVALNAERDLAWLNRERAANELPGGIVLNRRWSTDCAAHDAYERANGGTLTHYETSGNGFSPGGLWVGTTSILAAAPQWTAADNPWENAPLHLAQLYAPSLSVVGIDDGHGYQCTTTWAGMQSTVGADTVLTYPGNGVRAVSPSEDASENPFVPGQFVGIPAGTTAGRELFVYLNQAGQMGQAPVKFVSATLSGPHGPVAIKTVDNTTPTVGPSLAGGIIIPVKPLAANTNYTASVTLVDGSGTISHSWSFTTGASSTGSTACRVPRLTNLTLAQARQAIAKGGCRLGKVRHVYDRHVKKGRVLRQGRRHGRVLPAGTAISVVLSKGSRH